MRKNAIKKILFTLASLASLPVRADYSQDNDLRLMDELPVQERIVVRDHVLNFLDQHPEFINDAKVIAVDREGAVYVLDENLVQLASVGQPSCITRGM